MAIYELGDILNISGGTTPDTKNKKLWKQELNWYTPIDLKNNTHTERKITYGITKTIPMGSVLISSRAPIGYVGIAKSECWHSQGVKGFINDEKILKNKYLYYWIIKNINLFISLGSGSTFKEISLSNIKKIEIESVSLKEQQKIIDIIEPNESLFLKYSNCVRINSISHVRNDIKNLIDIIEPIDSLQNNLNKITELIKKILILNYNSLTTKEVPLNSIINLLNSKYENQKEYYATNGVGEFKTDYLKKIILDKKIPSRANISPKENSFILSKLDGENKLFYFNKKPKEVFSTGFFNFATNYPDHILEFLLSDSFKNQKTNLSTGTTMMGINNESLKNIKIKEAINKNDLFCKILFNINDLNNKINFTKNKIINLLIK